MERIKTVYSKLILCVVVLALLLGLGIVCTETWDEVDGDAPNTSVDSQAIAKEILASKVKTLNIATYTESQEFMEALNSFKSINGDVIGYIRCNQLSIDDPIVYSERDNSVYLRKNVYGEDDVNGTLYLDYRCTPLVSTVYLVHGHNMKSGEQFAELPSLLGLETLDGLETLKFYDEDGLREYTIVSVFSMNSAEETLSLEPFASAQEIEEMKNAMITRSQVPTSNIPDGIDLLLLNTCWYGESGNEHNLHCIVVGVR